MGQFMPKIKKLTCQRCGHEWWPRKQMPPGLCPQCRSALWRRPREESQGKEEVLP